MSQIELKPKCVFDCFAEVNQVPRPSKKEEKMMAFLQDFAARHQLPCKLDACGNVLISKPATPGMENRKTVVLQSHMDMVCEKNRDVEFDFEKDAIQTYVDGEWMRAKGTTLGADDGIGVAMQMAVLAADDIQHGPLECLFTRDEETGLSGAFALEAGFLAQEIEFQLGSVAEAEVQERGRHTATFLVQNDPQDTSDAERTELVEFIHPQMPTTEEPTSKKRTGLFGRKKKK